MGSYHYGGGSLLDQLGLSSLLGAQFQQQKIFQGRCFHPCVECERINAELLANLRAQEEKKAITKEKRSTYMAWFRRRGWRAGEVMPR